MSVEKYGLLRPFFNVGQVRPVRFLPGSERSCVHSSIRIRRRGLAAGKAAHLKDDPIHVASINLYKEL